MQQVGNTETYLEPSPISAVMLFAKIINSFLPRNKKYFDWKILKMLPKFYLVAFVIKLFCYYITLIIMVSICFFQLMVFEYIVNRSSSKFIYAFVLHPMTKKQPPEMVNKMDAFQNSKFTGKHIYRSFFRNKVASDA